MKENKKMARKSKKTRKPTRSAKKRLALPMSWVKGYETARNSLKTAKKKSTHEIQKKVKEVADHEVLKKIRQHKMIKQARKTQTDISREFETRVRRITKEFDAQFQSIRSRLPVPTRSEVETLSRKVNQLSKKVDEISGSRRSAAAN
jgi:DNA anti-recombination protein RmuC